MIFGVGTDIVAVERMAEFFRHHGKRGLDKVLSAAEHDECAASRDPGRFLAKRFAAKEALGKALGTGVRAPMLMPRVTVAHDELGKPLFRFLPPLADYLADRGLSFHLSLSDERDYVVAFVIAEKP